MRKTLMLLATPLAVMPLAAQEFRGTIAMEISGGEMPQPMNMTLYIDGSRQAIVMKAPPSAGPMAGMEMRMVLDPETRKMTVLMPKPAGMPTMPGVDKGFKIDQDIEGVPTNEEAPADVSVRKLGTSQTIAGMSCDDYEVTTSEGKVNMCITDELGRYMVPEVSGMGRNPEIPAWARAFGRRPAWPLKIWGGADGTQAVVTSVNRGPVPAAMLDPNPEGYGAFPGMGG
jgi:hypothetical protein